MSEEKKYSVHSILRNRFPSNEYVLIQEVSDKSGFSRSRSLDYMLINLWESRGLAITGIEVKSNRSDWLRELKNPAKQENHLKYCDYFYLLTDNMAAFPEEIPINWGHWHINEKGTFKVVKQAPKLTSTPVDRSLLCAMLRRAATKNNYVHVDDIQDRIKLEAERIKEKTDYATREKLKNYDQLKKEVDEFVEATGVEQLLDLKRSWHSYGGKEIGAAVKYILANGIDHYQKQLIRLGSDAERIHAYISETLKQLNGHE